MSNEEMIKKADELYENEEFRAKVASCETEEEIIAIFKEVGIEITKDDFAAAKDYIEKPELSADDLDDVSGGGVGGLLLLAGGAYVLYKFTRGYIDGAKSAQKKYCKTNKK